jgi:hypothetical protein
MLKQIKSVLVGIGMLGTFSLFGQTQNCEKCIPATTQIVKGVVIPPPIVVPKPQLNLPSGQHPFNTDINIVPNGSNNKAANSTQMVTEYMWEGENKWNEGTSTKLKKSGNLLVRNRIGDKTSEITKVTLEIYYNQVLLIGNSFTQHGPHPPIKWFGDWGMAASAPDKDYKSVLERYLQAKRPDTKVKIMPTARIEHDFNNYDFNFAQEIYGELFKTSDLVVLRLGENNKDWEIPGSQYKAIMTRFINMAKQHPNARVVITSVFWQGYPNTNKILKELADENGYDWVDLIELGKDSSNYAYGLFENEAVAYHPGDKGMKAIADAIYEKIK